MKDAEAPPPGVRAGPGFCTTHWSVVLAAGKGATGDPRAQAALEILCRDYWYPIYAFVRRSGHGPHDAQDLTQEYLSRLVERRCLEGVEPGPARFRSFLLATLKQFLVDDWRRSQARKRGGGVTFLSLDGEAGEEWYRADLAGTANPETAYEQAWANAVLARVLERLRARYAANPGRRAVFEALSPVLGWADAARSTYDALGASLGLSEGAVKVAVHRLRKEFGRLLREEIAATVSDPAEVDAEIRRLIEVSSGVLPP